MATRSILIDRLVDPPGPGPARERAIAVIAECGRTAELSHVTVAPRALACCAALGALGIAPGDLVLLALPITTEAIELLLGCVLRGALPCVVAPVDRHAASSTAEAVRVLCRLYRPRAVVVPSVAAGHLAATLADTGVRVLGHDELHQAAAGATPVVCRRGPGDPHHVQLTSGSLTHPKAAVITHRNVEESIGAMTSRVAYRPDSGDHTVSWLPLHHDMGLMTLLCNIHTRGAMLQMQPSSFIRHPLGWLRQLSARRATTSAVPTFALRYCVRRFNPDLLTGVDLSACRSLCVGAERVDAPSLRAFAATFAPYGFHASALQPCYGMAESTLAVTMHSAAVVPSHEPVHLVCDTIDRRAAATRHEAVPCDPPLPGGPPVDTLVSAGRPVHGMACMIRGPAGQALVERRIGEIVVRGSSLMQGYLPCAGAAATPPPFDPSGWFATGDIGYLADGQLYILGRSKEVIILRGANRFPEDFERALADHPAVCRGVCAAIGVPDDRHGTERLVMLVEARPEDATASHRAELQQCLQRTCGHGADDLLFVAPGSLPRTTSGKLQRPRCRELHGQSALQRLPVAEAAGLPHDTLPGPALAARPASRSPAAPAPAAGRPTPDAPSTSADAFTTAPGFRVVGCAATGSERTDLRTLALRPVLQALEPFGAVPARLRAMLSDAALRQFDSDMIIGDVPRTVALRGTASATARPAWPASPGGDRGASPAAPLPTANAGLDEADLAAADQVIGQVRVDGLSGHLGDLMRSFGRFMFTSFFTPDQQARAHACARAGAGFTFLASDAGGPSLAGWRSIAEPVGDGSGRIRLSVAKVWGIEAHREGAAVVVARLPGVAVPAAYLVWPDRYARLDRRPCGAPFLEGALQLGNVNGVVEVASTDRLRAGGTLMLNRYLTLVRPFFVRALMAQLEWMAAQGRVTLGRGALQAHGFIAAAAQQQSHSPHYRLDGMRAVLALKFASNTLLGALVRGGAVRRGADQRDLLAFTKMEGSCYRCYCELRRGAPHAGGDPPDTE